MQRNKIAGNSGANSFGEINPCQQIFLILRNLGWPNRICRKVIWK